MQHRGEEEKSKAVTSVVLTLSGEMVKRKTSRTSDSETDERRTPNEDLNVRLAGAASADAVAGAGELMFSASFPLHPYKTLTDKLALVLNPLSSHELSAVTLPAPPVAAAEEAASDSEEAASDSGEAVSLQVPSLIAHLVVRLVS